MSNDRASLSFGLNYQALAILHFLAGRDPDFATYTNGRYDIEVETFPWYNGWEKGVCLVVRRGPGDNRALCITFGEHRNTDGIFVDHWEDTAPHNCPTLENVDEAAYEKAYCNRKSFEYGRAGDAAGHIYELMEGYYVAQAKKAAEAEKTSEGGSK